MNNEFTYEFREPYTEKGDERDSIFVRLGLKEGDGKFEDYYGRHPERLKFDDKLRSRPFKGGTGGKYYNELSTGVVESTFGFLRALAQAKNSPPKEQQIKATPEQFSEIIMGLARYYGADDVKIMKADDSLFYSHRGKDPNYGVEVTMKHKYAIVYSAEMPESYIDTAPDQPAAIAVTKGYVDVALIGMALEALIHEYGYEAYAHVNGIIQLGLVKAGEDSFLGEMGKSTMLVTKSCGSRVRLGVVTTDIELVETPADRQYIREFCELCNRCKNNCPVKAIKDKRTNYSPERCMTMWQHYGTDCGICMSSCPFSHHLPKELTDDLSTPEKRERLAAYCDERFPKREASKDFPAWVQVMYDEA